MNATTTSLPGLEVTELHAETPAPCKTRRTPRSLALHLPPEFVALCDRDGVAPDQVLRGLIADLCSLDSHPDHPRADGYCSNGSDERSLAREWYDRAGYSWLYRSGSAERAS